MLGDPGRPERATRRRQLIAAGTPKETWALALLEELADLAAQVDSLEARVTAGPKPTTRSQQAADDIADGLCQRPEQAYRVVLRILARLDTLPTADQIAAVRAGLYPAKRMNARTATD